jgi:hypothetical protein
MLYINFFPTLFSWWYSKGLNSLFEFLTVFFVHTSDYFSPLDIIANFFRPWKRNVSQKGRGLDALGEWFADNLVSRLVGFFMRFILILSYVVFLIFYLAFLVASILFWILMPFLVFLALIYIFI